MSSTRLDFLFLNLIFPVNLLFHPNLSARYVGIVSTHRSTVFNTGKIKHHSLAFLGEETIKMFFSQVTQNKHAKHDVLAQIVNITQGGARQLCYQEKQSSK